MVGLHQPAFVSARRQRLFYPLSENTTRQPAYAETVVQSYNAGVKNQLARLGTAALELVFPSRCVGCGEYGSFLCSACESSLPRLKQPYCKNCTEPNPGAVLCSRCVLYPLSIDKIRAPYLMEGQVEAAIYALKYRNLRAIAPTLGELLAKWLESSRVPGDLLVPIPLHWRRHRVRGYNQSELLAKEMGKRSGLPVRTDLLVRTRDSAPQVSLSNPEDRARNVEGSFQCKADVRGLRIILVDDVVTTGSTMSACALPLKAAGASSVWGVAIARTSYRV